MPETGTLITKKIKPTWNPKIVTDANKPLIIRVQPEDIAGSIACDHEHCVIARAIMRTYGTPYVDVGASTVTFGKTKNNAKRYRLDAVGREQVAYFDTHPGVFAPTRIKLNVPSAPQPPRARDAKRKNRPSGAPRKRPTR